MKQQFIYNIGGTIRLTTYDKNRANIPTSAQVTIYMNDGASVIQPISSASINATTGEMTYVIGPTVFPSVDLNYKAVWQYVVNSNTYYETQLMDCVLSILSIPITDDDLFDELPSLKKTNYQRSGTAQSATSNTLVDTKALKEGDDYWKGGQLEILGGTGAGQTCDVTGFTQSTGTIAVTPNFSTTPDNTSTYRVVKSFSSTINRCFEKIEQMLYDRGKEIVL